MRHIGTTLKTFIEQNRIPKTEVAMRAGISKTYLSTIFNKPNLDAAMLEKLCAAIGLSPMAFFDMIPAQPAGPTGISAGSILGTASVSMANEKLYNDIIADKERTICILLETIDDLRKRDKNETTTTEK